MKIRNLHSWQITSAEAREIQKRLAKEVLQVNEIKEVHLIAGVDISVPKHPAPARAAIVVMSYPEFEVVERQISEGQLYLPYIPGLLSFREAPLILAACQKLLANPDLILVDGQGISHPRRFGLASHLGVLLDTPTIGCAKSRLCGNYSPPPDMAGTYSELIDNGDIIGAVLRSKVGTKPIYVSIGHKIDLPTAIHWIMKCCRGYRLPEPSRLTHLVAGRKLPTQSTSSININTPF